MRGRLPVLFALVPACTLLNPAFDERNAVGEDGTSTVETGDGDPGDGDGDTSPGDGDGDGDTSDGDGDGDGDSGDGDADTSTGTSTSTGDGDGDPCKPAQIFDPHAPFELNFATWIDPTGAPQFEAYPVDCYALTICLAEQVDCGANSEFLARYSSGGDFEVGGFSDVLAPIKLVFHDGLNKCGEPLVFDFPQSFVLEYVAESNSEELIQIRVPCTNGDPPTLWVGEDGSTFYDPQLSQPAALWQ